MELGYELLLTQQLSPKQLQSLSILQMDQLELDRYVQQLYLENPVIEFSENLKKEEQDEALFGKLSNYCRYEEEDQYSSDPDRDESRYESGLPVLPDIRQDLREQLLSLPLTEEEQMTVDCLLLYVNDRGYIEDFDDLFETCGISREQLERGLSILQSLEPVGVCARDIRECLLLQLSRRPEPEELRRAAARIIEDCLEALAENHIAGIARRCRLSLDTVKEAAGLIRSLNPYPGGYSGHGQPGISPDIILHETGDGFAVLQNDASCPQITLSKYYLSLMREAPDSSVSEYIRGKVAQAEWVIQCIEQRKQTLQLIAEEIVREQEPFFRTGTPVLKYISQAEMARRIGICESTVSRAIHAKYLQCKWGTFPLKFFFSRGSNKLTRSGSKSRDVICKTLKEIIAGEDQQNPLSDIRIAEILKERDMEISRRTVTKYRAAMGIPDSEGRKY